MSAVVSTGNEFCLLFSEVKEYISTIQVTQMLYNIRRPLSVAHVMSAFAKPHSHLGSIQNSSYNSRCCYVPAFTVRYSNVCS
jgi:hypothetical protein